MPDQVPADYLEITLQHRSTGQKTHTVRVPIPEHNVTRYSNIDAAHMIEITWRMVDADDENGDSHD